MRCRLYHLDHGHGTRQANGSHDIAAASVSALCQVVAWMGRKELHEETANKTEIRHPRDGVVLRVPSEVPAQPLNAVVLFVFQKHVSDELSVASASSIPHAYKCPHWPHPQSLSPISMTIISHCLLGRWAHALVHQSRTFLPLRGC